MKKRTVKTLRLGVPKGSLQEATLSLLRKAGFGFEAGPRSYILSADDPQIEGRLIRAQEISRYVQHGFLDAGITGADWVAENGSDVHVVCEICKNKQTMQPARWVLAVPENSTIRSVKDLEGKRIATELVRLTRRWLKAHGVRAEVEFSWGATEVKVPELVDAIVELTETGSSLRAHNLRIVETLVTSYPQLIANKQAWQDPWKRAKIEQLAILIQGALVATNKVLLKMNAKAGAVKAISAILPSLHAPTVSALSAEGWAAIESVVDQTAVRDLIPRLKKLGAEGIIELPLNKVIP